MAQAHLEAVCQKANKDMGFDPPFQLVENWSNGQVAL
jgi:hypothetical protein